MKKRRKRLKKKFRRFLTLLIIIIFGFILLNKIGIKEKSLSVINYLFNKNEFQNKIKNNTKEKIDEELENVIISFFNDYYKLMKKKEKVDISKYFIKSSKDKYIYDTSLDLLISSRKKNINDLGLYDAYYNLTFKSVEKENNIITLEVIEDSFLKFNYTKNTTSKVYNVSNKFEFIKENGEYKIKSYYKEQGFYIMVDDLVNSDESISNIKEQLEKIKISYEKKFDEKFEKQKEDLKEYLNNKNKKFKKCDNKYDSKAAVTFAKNHILTKTDVYYGEYGGNCQNLVSLSLLKGNIPPDTIGDYIWKHYDSNVDETNAKEGRTPSFTSAPYFYEYAKNNEGYGLCSEVDVNIYYAKEGDVILVGYDNSLTHSTIVTKIVKDEKGNALEVLVSSNTGDVMDYPVSAYSYPEKSLIKILGWNN